MERHHNPVKMLLKADFEKEVAVDSPSKNPSPARSLSQFISLNSNVGATYTTAIPETLPDSSARQAADTGELEAASIAVVA